MAKVSARTGFALLAQIAGIKAEIGNKRRPNSYGGKPSVVVDIEPVNATGSSVPARP